MNTRTLHTKIQDLSESLSKATKCFRLEIINNLLFVQLQCSARWWRDFKVLLLHCWYLLVMIGSVS